MPGDPVLDGAFCALRLRRIATVRTTSHPPTRAYVTRRRSEGLSWSVRSTGSSPPLAPSPHAGLSYVPVDTNSPCRYAWRLTTPSAPHLHPAPPQARQDPRPRTRHPHARLAAPPTTSPNRRLTSIGASRLRPTYARQNALLHTATAPVSRIARRRMPITCGTPVLPENFKLRPLARPELFATPEWVLDSRCDLESAACEPTNCVTPAGWKAHNDC